MAFLGGFSSCSEASSELLSVLCISSNRLALCSHQYGANNMRTIAVKHLASHGSQGLGLLGGTWCCSEPRELVRDEPLCSPAIPWGWGAWWWLLEGTNATSADTGEVLVPLGQQSPPWGLFLTFPIQPGPLSAAAGEGNLINSLWALPERAPEKGQAHFGGHRGQWLAAAVGMSPL